MYQFENFIRCYDQAFPAEYCNELIEYVNNMEKAGYGQLRDSPRHIKDDVAVHLTDEVKIKLSTSVFFSEHFFKIFTALFKEYQREFSVISDDNLSIHDIKAQRTAIGGGYHVWHHERMERQHTNRVLVYTVYLNDVEQGGETEFLYYPIRVRPQQGTLLLFPAGFTHAHRGNPPISNEKYIITGWVEY